MITIDLNSTAENNILTRVLANIVDKQIARPEYNGWYDFYPLQLQLVPEEMNSRTFDDLLEITTEEQYKKYVKYIERKRNTIRAERKAKEDKEIRRWNESPGYGQPYYC